MRERAERLLRSIGGNLRRLATSTSGSGRGRSVERLSSLPANPVWERDLRVLPQWVKSSALCARSRAATRCHSVGLHPWAAVTSCVSWRSIKNAGNRSRPRLSTSARSGSHHVEPPVDRVSEDALGDRRCRRDAHDGAHVAVAERLEDAVDHGNEGRRLRTVGEHDERDVEDGRPVVERAGDALVARDRQQRVRVLGHGHER